MKRKIVTLFLAVFVCSNLLAQDNRPNVLFISADDLNNWAGYLGHPDAITPNMDRIAKSGVFFRNAYSQFPVCGPSRSSVMSGMYYHTLGIEKLQAADNDVETSVEAKGSKLLHSYFDDHGYKTMAAGKILHKHVPDNSVEESGGRGGWDFNLDSNGEQIFTNWVSNNTITDWAPFTGKEEDMSDYEAAEWVVDRLEEDHSKPFFMMTGFLRPHVPWYVPQKYFDMYDPTKLTLPEYDSNDYSDIPQIANDFINEGYPRTEWAIQEGQWRDIVHAYLASITFMDAQLGKILDALESSTYKDNTIVVLWSDHGYHLGEKNTFQKHTLWERSAVVPMIISAPGMQQNIGSNANVQLMDMYPTLIDLCSLPENDKLLGRSLKPLLENPEKAWNYPAFTFRRTDAKSVFYDKYHYIEYSDESIELYDLDNDANEWSNLADDPTYANTISEMKGLFESYNVFEPIPDLSKITIPAIEDAYIRGGDNEDISYGTSNPEELLVKTGSNSNFFRNSLLKFDLTDISNIESAQLYIYGSASSSTPVGAYTVTSNDWDESTVTWSSVYSYFDSEIDVIDIGSSDSWRHFDISAAAIAKMGEILSIGLEDPSASNNKVTFYSKEYESGEFNPYLVITEKPIKNKTILTYDNFENGWGNYTDGGADALLYTSDTFAYDGSGAINIQNNSGESSSFYHTNGIDVTNYDELEVSFFFYAKNLEINEKFILSYFDGTEWTTISTWTMDVDFTNNQFYPATSTISKNDYNFPNNSKFRFQSSTSGQEKDIYIDEIKVQGISQRTAPLSISEKLNTLETEINIFPNPASDILNIQGLVKDQSIQMIKIFDINGALQYSKEIELKDDETLDLVIDIKSWSKGLYILNIYGNKNKKNMKFIKN